MTNAHSSFDQINSLVDEAAERIDELLELLGVEYHRRGKGIGGTCPCHDSDNAHSFCMYPNFEIPCLWKCFTKHCEQEYGKNLTGFIRGVLSKNKGAPVSFGEALRFLEAFVGRRAEEVKIDQGKLERLRFIKQTAQLQGVVAPKLLLKRDMVRSRLIIPSEYYIKRGYSREVLDLYDVGLCETKGKPLYSRIVFPCYDPTNTYFVGAVARIKYENYKDYDSPKWKNSPNFNCGHYFFNYWRAAEVIRRSKVAVMVESQGDCLRMVEAGVQNVIGIFGSSLTEQQEILLESLGAMALILLFNNDEAGINCTKDIKERLARFYNLHEPQFETNDLGDLSILELGKELVPYIRNVEKGYANL